MSQVKRDAEAAEELKKRFEKSVIAATDAVIAEFGWMMTPLTSDQYSDVMVQVSNAIYDTMYEYKENAS